MLVARGENLQWKADCLQFSPYTPMHRCDSFSAYDESKIIEMKSNTTVTILKFIIELRLPTDV